MQAPLPPMLALEGGQVIGLVAVIAGGLAAILWPLMRALGRRLEGKSSTDSGLSAEVEALRTRLEQAESRVAELEERVEFTERLLSRLGDRESLPKGS